MARDNIDVAVMQSPTIKPLDEASLVESVRCKYRLVAGALPMRHDRYGINREALAGRIKRWLP
ncbi:hypothetical protein A9974_25925 [Achromobacter sp. UMC71]|nr:hypothetical protein [Achromobacter sp. UMC71]